MILRFIIYSNLFVSLCVTILTWGTMKISGVAYNHKYLLISGLGTFVVYNLHRIIGQILPGADKYKKETVGLNDKLMIVLSILASMVLLVTGFTLSLQDIIVLIPASIISIFYVSDLFLKRVNTGLRAIPMFKVFVIAMVWTIITVVFPNSQNIDNWSIAHTVLVIERFFFIVAITIPFDIRDMGLDSAGIRTIPQVMGVKKAKIIAIIFLLISLGSSIYIWMTEPNIYPSIWPLIAFYGIVSLLIGQSSRERTDLYYSLWVESTMLFWGLILIWLG